MTKATNREIAEKIVGLKDWTQGPLPAKGSVLYDIVHSQVEKIELALNVKDADLHAEQYKRVNEYARAALLVEWINNPKRKSAVHAFTEGPERQVAYAIEKKLMDERKRGNALVREATYVLSVLRDRQPLSHLVIRLEEGLSAYAKAGSEGTVKPQ